MAIEKFDHVDYLKTDEEIYWALRIAYEEDPGDGSLILETLNDIARAKGMSALAKETGVSREGLYKALSKNGNPQFVTILKVLKAIKFRPFSDHHNNSPLVTA